MALGAVAKLARAATFELHLHDVTGGIARSIASRLPMLLAVLLFVGGCSSRKEPPGANNRAAPSPSLPNAARPAALAPLPNRAEVVARADALAVAAAKQGGVEGAKLLLQAADLRRRVFRVEGKTADGLEAIELLRAASRTPSPLACDAEIELALLEGEMTSDPAKEYVALYGARARHRTEPCARRVEETLATLTAFEPARDVLEGVDRLAGPAAPRASANAGVIQPALPPEQPKEPAQITKVELYGGKEATRVVVFVTRPTLFEVGDLAGDAQHGPRVFIDIKDSKLRAKHAYDGDGLVQRVRLGEKGTLSRVVLDLTAAASRRVFYLPEPFRLVIDVSSDLGAPESENKGPRRIRRVVLDPGHGGHDPGAVGASGLREKDVVLDVAHRAAPLVARELGISTLLTRDADVFVPLDERVAHANAFSSDLFVSIHCNASEVAASRGVMTFVLDASRDDLALRVAARENAASAEASVELANAMSHVLDPASLARSNHFAELLQRAAVASLSPHYSDVLDQGVKSAGFYVLAGARMPAVLFETSFISNLSEERRLDSGDYRQKMADAIVNAVRAYRDGM